ncbi:Ig-like domain-containing protein, partial [Porphyromonas sp. COT-108 OH2963]|uniref:Ig-like domain-containing protein n=1 Tax=Porphyromonas sp. COT-108 OH2963 TaxID=1515614 RepID=UPI00190F8BBB
VDSNGEVTTHKEGSATITATSVDGGKTATCRVTVKRKEIKVTGITVSPTEKSVVEGESFTITATVLPADADNKTVTWSSSASYIASVNDNGRVTTHKPGRATITATTADGGKTATCQVTVTKKEVKVTGITVSPTEKSVIEGESFTITCQVTVTKKEVKVTGITVSPTEKSVIEGESFTITATVQPADADNKAVRWSSSASDIATVDNQGKVTTHKPGKATITATTEDGGKTAGCEVTVKSKITEEYKALKKKAEELEEKIDNGEKELAGIKSSDKSINEKIKLMEALLKKINGIKSEIDSLSDEIEAKKDLLHESEYNELKEKKESLLSGIAELQSEAETYKQKLDKAAKEGKGDLSDLEIVDL